MHRLLSVGALLLIMSCQSAWAAECGGSSIPVNPCKRCRISGTITTHRDQSCVRGFSMNSSNYVILGYTVAKQASHGRVAVSGSSFTYTPAKAYVGTDTFSIEMDFLGNNKDVLVNFLDLTMEVAP
jgi:hypothetical protein